MIDLKNTYILNDRGELFDEYTKLGLSQGITPLVGGDCEYLTEKPVIIIKT